MKKLLLFSIAAFITFAFTSKQAVPYKVNKRKMPTGSDFKLIIPESLGDWKRLSYDEPSPDSDGDATYQKPDFSKVTMLFGLGVSFDDVQSVFNTVVTDATNNNTLTPDIVSKGTDPSYILFKKKSDGVSFFGWTRGNYYFSVETKNGAAILDDFMKAFPY